MSILLKNIPKQPWIYKFFDGKDKIIYIWKSVNLFSRVSSYFNWKSKLSFAKKKMVSQIKNIETIIVNNETESLILETTLIKKHKPKYNILMKDDKNHVYIKITDELIPRIIKTRVKTSSWSYFWPYISTGNVNNILKIIKKIFWYRSCNINFTNPLSLKREEIKENNIVLSNIWNTKIPCMDYYIWRCSAPCLKKEKNVKVYLDKIEEIRLFLKWDINNVKKKLAEKMKSHAKKLNFEEAKKIQNDIVSLNTLQENQVVRDKVYWDYDIINYCEKFNKFFIWLIEIREGKITNFNNYEIENKLEEEKIDIIKIFLERKIVENKTKNIWVSIKNITYIIPEKLNNIWWNIKIEIPKIWWKLDLLKLCYKNIYEYAYKKHLASLSTKWFTKKNMQNILDILWYKQINKNLIFECNDISHLSWTHTVASRSIIENWKSNTAKYKRFNIKNLKDLEINDFASMKETMERRLKEIEKTWIIPDLIIIDWWKWQLSSVMSIINKNKEIAKKLQIVSIAKREEELFLPYSTTSIILDKNSSELKLIQKIRDESHRFAITFNREKRIKSSKVNILESLPWFWPKTRTKILKKYWNIDNLSNIHKKELRLTLNKNQIQTLEDHWII